MQDAAELGGRLDHQDAGQEGATRDVAGHPELVVADLLQANASDAEISLQQRWITDEVFRTWQQEAELACTIPNVRGVDAQLLVGVGIRAAAELHAADATVIFQLISEYAATSQGKRIVRSSRLPNQERIAGWIQSAGTSIRRAA